MDAKNQFVIVRSASFPARPGLYEDLQERWAGAGWPEEPLTFSYARRTPSRSRRLSMT
jgi:hypothetical protein